MRPTSLLIIYNNFQQLLHKLALTHCQVTSATISYSIHVPKAPFLDQQIFDPPLSIETIFRILKKNHLGSFEHMYNVSTNIFWLGNKKTYSRNCLHLIWKPYLRDNTIPYHFYGFNRHRHVNPSMSGIFRRVTKFMHTS